MNNKIENQIFSELLAYNGQLKTLIEQFNKVSGDLHVEQEFEYLTGHEKNWGEIAEKNEKLDSDLKAYLISELSKTPNREPALEKLNVQAIQEKLSALKGSCETFVSLSNSLTEEDEFENLPVEYSVLEGLEILEKYCNEFDLNGVDLNSILDYEYDETSYRYTFLDRLGAFKDNIHANTTNRLSHVSTIVNGYLENLSTPLQETSQANGFECNSDYTAVKVNSENYYFTLNQARAFKYIYENNGAHLSKIADCIDSQADNFRLRDLFDKGQHPAWNKIIIQDEKRKGFYLIKK
jgi:hypothetical protein